MMNQQKAWANTPDANVQQIQSLWEGLAKSMMLLAILTLLGGGRNKNLEIPLQKYIQNLGRGGRLISALPFILLIEDTPLNSWPILEYFQSHQARFGAGFCLLISLQNTWGAPGISRNCSIICRWPSCAFFRIGISHLLYYTHTSVSHSWRLYSTCCYY